MVITQTCENGQNQKMWIRSKCKNVKTIKMKTCETVQNAKMGKLWKHKKCENSKN